MCDDHKEYPALLSEYIRENVNGISLNAEPDPGSAFALFCEYEDGLLLLSDRIWENCSPDLKRRIRRAGRYRFLSDERLPEESAERIWRYRPADEVVRWIGTAFEETEREGTVVVGILSPSGGAAAEVCAGLTAEVVSRRRKTIGISFYPFSVFSGRQEGGNLSAVLYRSMAGAEDPFAGSEADGRQFCVLHPEDSWNLDGDSAAALLRTIKKAGTYGAVVAAVPPDGKMMCIYEECSHILTVAGNSPASEDSADRLEAFLAASGRQEPGPKRVRLTLPPLPSASYEDGWDGMLRHGSFMTQVKEAVKLLGIG